MYLAWQFQLNDSSAIGWVICMVYFVAAYFCVRAAIAKPAAVLWWLNAAALVVLGINKQLDLHTLLFEARGIMFAGVFALIIATIIALCFRKFAIQLLAVDKSSIFVSAMIISLVAILSLRYLSIPWVSDALVVHVFTEDPGISHVHVVEVVELGMIIVSVLASSRR